MLAFLTLSLLTSFLFYVSLNIHVHKEVADVAHFFHARCLDFAPVSKHVDLTRALVCAADLPRSDMNEAFRRTGLFHLLVVSGSHLVVLEWGLARLTNRFAFGRWLVTLALLIFVLCANAEPPVMRAFVHWLLRLAIRKFSLRWTPAQTVTTSGFLTLPFCNGEAGLRSLTLSWIASLSLNSYADDDRHSKPTDPSLTSKIKRWMKSGSLQNSRIYLVIAPALLSLSIPHPGSVLCNLLVGPVLSCLLFPFCLIAFVVPSLSGVLDHLWDATIAIVKLCASIIPDGLMPQPVPSFAILIYLGLLTLLAFLWERAKTSGIETLKNSPRSIDVLIEQSELAPSSPARRSTNSLFISGAVFLLLTISPTESSAINAKNLRSQLIVWNVGQGLWVTEVENGVCTHFDMGGEKAPWKQIEALCSKNKNRAHFSHWDWDHVSYVSLAIRRLSDLCVATPPAGTANQKRRRWIEKLPRCSIFQDGSREIRTPYERPLEFPRKTFLKTMPKTNQMKPNDLSRVFLMESRVLLPGDSTGKQEKKWSRESRINTASILVLGHHGSNTSTSLQLLSKLPRLRQAVASARFAKYGHPHIDVRLRLKRSGIALLSTEHWGSIRFEQLKKKPVSKKTQKGLPEKLAL